MSFQLDGKTVDHYCCLNEIDGSSNKRCGIGTFCHEFSHVMGLPDFYATNQASHRTLGSWDIMDYGPYNNNGNTPPNYTAYERWFMGWIEPTLLNTACSVTLPRCRTARQPASSPRADKVSATFCCRFLPPSICWRTVRKKDGTYIFQAAD